MLHSMRQHIPSCMCAAPHTVRHHTRHDTWRKHEEAAHQIWHHTRCGSTQYLAPHPNKKAVHHLDLESTRVYSKEAQVDFLDFGSRRSRNSGANVPECTRAEIELGLNDVHGSQLVDFLMAHGAAARPEIPFNLKSMSPVL